MRRHVGNLVVLALLGSTMLSGLLLFDHYQRQDDRAEAARLRREMAVADRLLAYEQEQVRAAARLYAQRPEVLRALALRPSGTAREALQGLVLEPTELVWLGDASGREVASRGEEPPFNSSQRQLLEAGLRGHEVYGMLPSGPWFNFEAVVPVTVPGRRDPGGVLRLARRLDNQLIAQIELTTGTRLVAAPGEWLVDRPALTAALNERPEAVRQLSERVDDWLTQRAGLTRQRPVAVQQLHDTAGQPAGLLALSAADEAVLPPERLMVGIWLLTSLVLLLAISRGLGSPGTAAAPLRIAPTEPTETWFSRPSDPRQAAALHNVAEHLNHHLNNALAVVIGNLELLRGRTDQTTASIMDDVASQSWWASSVVRRFQKACYRERLPHHQPVCLSEVYDEALMLLGPRLGDRLVRAEGLTGLQVTGIHADLVEVLVALLENAAQATEAGGRITITAEAAGAWVSLVVRDDGEGMSSEVRHQAATLFFTTRGPRAAGLGLSLVDGVVARHGGWWKLDSHPGEGCRVELHLPAWRAVAAPHFPRPWSHG